MNRHALSDHLNRTPNRSGPEAWLKRQRALADYFRQQAEAAEHRIAALRAEGEKAKLAICRRYEEQLTELRERLDRSEFRLGRSRETIVSLDQEFDRVTRELEAERDRLTADEAAGPHLSRARDLASRETIRALEEEVRVLTSRLAACQRVVAGLRRNGATEGRR